MASLACAMCRSMVSNKLQIRGIRLRSRHKTHTTLALLPKASRLCTLRNQNAHVRKYRHKNVSVDKQIPHGFKSIQVRILTLKHAYTCTCVQLQPPLIMVGPGTGLAPLRCFIQERAHARGECRQAGQVPGKVYALMCLYVCVCVCVYIYIYTCMYVCMYIYIYNCRCDCSCYYFCAYFRRVCNVSMRMFPDDLHATQGHVLFFVVLLIIHTHINVYVSIFHAMAQDIFGARYVLVQIFVCI